MANIKSSAKRDETVPIKLLLRQLITQPARV